MFDTIAGAPPQCPTAWPVWSRADLYAEGWTWRTIRGAITDGVLIRARRDAYLDGSVDAATRVAGEVGGQLACVSELARRGVFVLERGGLHVRMHARNGRVRRTPAGLRVHWTGGDGSRAANVPIIDALVEAMRCQPPIEAIATLDSALHRGLIDEPALAEVRQRLPKRLRVLCKLVDARAEAGGESIMRLLLRKLGCQVESQVEIPGVGRVDFLVDGWLIVECDSQAHHSTWEHQRRDRRRDQAAAARGYATFRPIAEDIFWNREVVVAALKGLQALGENLSARPSRR